VPRLDTTDGSTQLAVSTACITNVSFLDEKLRITLKAKPKEVRVHIGQPNMFTVIGDYSLQFATDDKFRMVLQHPLLPKSVILRLPQSHLSTLDTHTPMRFSQFLLLVIATSIACCSTITSAEDPVSIKSMTAPSDYEPHRNLKGANDKVTHLSPADEERVGPTTPSFKQLFGFLKLPKFQGLSKLPVLKQVAQIRAKFGPKVANLYLKWSKFVRNRPTNAQL
jgi:hypothetical protein